MKDTLKVYFNEVGLDLFYPSQETAEGSSKECTEISTFIK
jgi:hypothetical protein